MKISVITVCYNAIDTIEDTIASVAGQTFQDVEHLVIDGASTDGTQEVVRKYAGSVSRIVSEPDNGTYDAMNKGLALATGDVIGFLNADDVFADSTVLDQVACVFLGNDVEVSYADLVYVKKKDINKTVRYWKAGVFKTGVFAHGWCPPHPTFYARRSVYQRLGNFDTSYKLAADADLMIRVLEKGRVPAVYVPRVWVKMRIGGQTNLSISNIVRQNREILNSLDSHGISISRVRFIASKLYNRILQRWFRANVGREAAGDW